MHAYACADHRTTRIGAEMTTQTVWANEMYFAPDPTSPAEARDLVTCYLTDHDLRYLVDDVCLVVSELVANARVHTQTPIRVKIEELLFCLKVTVFDETLDVPRLSLTNRVGDGPDGGSGWWVVDACSSDWGIDLEGDEGTCTWALFAVRPKSTWVESAPTRDPRGQAVMPRPRGTPSRRSLR
jgi:hypothetical protein